jgi:hypothetical protein
MMTRKLYSSNNGDSGIFSSGFKEAMKSGEEKKNMFLINMLPLSFNSSDTKNKELKKEYHKGIRSIAYVSSIPGVFFFFFLFFFFLIFLNQ